MNQKNILPYDGLAYVIDDTEGEFEWPKVTACLAETIPWRIETARLFGREIPVPRMTAWFGDADYTYSGIRHQAAVSAMDLNMMMVETGSSIGSVAKPKAPPAAPDAVAKALCRSRDPA
jgi:hypothetical protein